MSPAAREAAEICDTDGASPGASQPGATPRGCASAQGRDPQLGSERRYAQGLGQDAQPPQDRVVPSIAALWAAGPAQAGCVSREALLWLLWRLRLSLATGAGLASGSQRGRPALVPLGAHWRGLRSLPVHARPGWLGLAVHRAALA